MMIHSAHILALAPCNRKSGVPGVPGVPTAENQSISAISERREIRTPALMRGVPGVPWAAGVGTPGTPATLPSRPQGVPENTLKIMQLRDTEHRERPEHLKTMMFANLRRIDWAAAKVWEGAP